MTSLPKYNYLLNLNIDKIDLNKLFNKLVKNISQYLELKPKYSKFKIIIEEENNLKKQKAKNVLDVGVNRINNNGILTIILDKNYSDFLPFILLRECYYLFIKDFKNYEESKKLIVNQILLNDLSNAPKELIDKWNYIINNRITNLDQISKGINKLTEFERIGIFFRLKRTLEKFDPVKFFFKNINHFNFRSEDEIHHIFNEEFLNYSLKSIKKKNLIVETIYCITKIFYKVKEYKNLLSYKKFFKSFKGNILETNLSLRGFTEGMEWIKNKSYISPSYQLNYNSIGIVVFILVLKFNPKLRKKEIFKVLKKFPFFISPKLSFNGFGTYICGYIISPYQYFQDLLNFLEKIKNFNFILKYWSLIRSRQKHFVNLNHFRDFFEEKRFINKTHQNYDKKYEIESEVNFGERFYDIKLSIFDFLILDRIRFFSVSGFGFERRNETLKILKTDLLNELTNKKSIILELEEYLKIFHQSINFRREFIGVVENNKKLGFFGIRERIDLYLQIVDFLDRIISDNKKIKSNEYLRKFIDNQAGSMQYNDYLLIKNKELVGFIIKRFFTFYFNSKMKYMEIVRKYKQFRDFINLCYQLRIFNLDNIIRLLENKDIISKIYGKKQRDLEKMYNKYKLYKINSTSIEERMDEFIKNNPPMIYPHLINTISDIDYVSDHIQLIVKASIFAKRVIESLSTYFPRFLIYYSKNRRKGKNYYVEISCPKLSRKEKKIFFSYLKNKLKDDLIFAKSFLWSGFLPGFTNRNFYDFTKKRFFYTPDLFDQYFLFVKNTFPNLSKLPEEKNQAFQSNMWDQVDNFECLIEEVEKHDYSSNLDFSILHLTKLLDFNINLNENLLNDQKYLELKKNFFFQNYVDSINFLPAFSKFNLEQFYLYIYSFDLGKIDYKLLFINSFQKVQYPAKIEKTNSLFIRYIMPFRAPNLSYINWITKSKRAIREYCTFSIKKMHTIFHTNFNLTPDGWYYSADKFKVHMQKVLFDPKYNIKIPELKEFDVSKVSETQRFGKNSPEFKSLTQIYDTEPIDIKSHLGTKRYPTIKNIKTLLEKNLIFPYLSFKNLALDDEILFILPNAKAEHIQKLLKVFSYFNLAHIYEIHGEFFIYGFNEEIHFENGLFIKLFFPKCELSEFFKIFDKLFDYLDIDHYIILHDLVDGKTLLKNIYGGLDFLDSYNPLLNFEWSEKDKKWINHKIFGYKFEPNYPNLSPKDQIK